MRLEVIYRTPDEIRANPKNARVHPPEQIEQLKSSIEKFGFTNPILIDEVGEVIAGHGRLEAANQLALDLIPTITLEGLTPQQRRAYLLADNKIALGAQWDMDLLRSEIQSLMDEIGDVPGFEDFEFEALATEPEKPAEKPVKPLEVVVTVETATEQKNLLERLKAEGFNARTT